MQSFDGCLANDYTCFCTAGGASGGKDAVVLGEGSRERELADYPGGIAEHRLRHRAVLPGPRGRGGRRLGGGEGRRAPQALGTGMSG